MQHWSLKRLALHGPEPHCFTSSSIEHITEEISIWKTKSLSLWDIYQQLGNVKYCASKWINKYLFEQDMKISFLLNFQCYRYSTAAKGSGHVVIYQIDLLFNFNILLKESKLKDYFLISRKLISKIHRCCWLYWSSKHISAIVVVIWAKLLRFPLFKPIWSIICWLFLKTCCLHQ